MSNAFKKNGSPDYRIKLKFISQNTLGREQLNIKLQLNTFRNDRIRTLNMFYASGEMAPLLTRCRLKTNQVKVK
ncbi:hypothetical protein O3M35_002927 [Rhynocoris fuscipes]|uniref:Uncharacterized protein n=1 Tax=Rhynocoris fuscipes TaxID=488301 RepID=A0AAW1CN84_9HEMI